MTAESRQLFDMVKQFDEELIKVKSQTPALGTPWLLGEVMCGDQSQLTQQMQQLGKHAFRFSRQDGDLSTCEGRTLLFQKVCRHRPQHIWYSPVCGPWSSWSQLNASKSLHQYDEYVRKRQELLYQIALGITLYRHQVGQGYHLHWEQPLKSLMFRNPNMSEVHQHTQACQFDMCRAGNLRDPETQQPMKKGMTVLTSYPPLYNHLHGMTCNHQHVHQPLEGSCKPKPNQPAILRTQYSESYTQKFARMVVKVLIKGGKQWPFNWRPGMLCLAHQDAVCAASSSSKVRRPAQFERSELVQPIRRADPENKRLKTDRHQGDAPSLEMCQQVIQMISSNFPRVGKREFTEKEAKQQLQQIFPDKHITRVVGCKGSERTLAPPPNMHAQEAPFRKALLLRRDGSIQYEKNWEKWVHLSQRQMTRPARASRLNVTVFARDHDKKENPPSPENERSAPEPSSSDQRPEGMLEDAVPDSVVELREPPKFISAETTADSDVASRNAEELSDKPTSVARNAPAVSEVTSNEQSGPVLTQQSYRFQQLPRWEQQNILRMHKNLGHPSNDRLAKALQNSGYRPEVVQAAQEIQCQICAANQPPKHARPATLKTMLDFNHKIYVDGVTWTNQAGKNYHFYHVLDAGTNYHVAISAPAKTTESFLQIMNQHWLSWAGPPREMVVDSGTELNSSQVDEFVQRFGIRSTTTTPEAHWQSGKIERHGSFLQTMLDKMDMEHPIQDYNQLQMALNQATHAKNALSIRHGYAPEIIVFGKHSRLPGSVLSDESLPSHESIMEEGDPMSNQEFRQLLHVRESARKAYHIADNSDVLRRAALRRACPSRGHFTKGEWVMIWRNNPLKQLRWQGPHRVIIQDGQHVVWCTSGGKIYRSAPENTRKAFPQEGSPEGPDLPEDVTPLMLQIQRMQSLDNQMNELDLDHLSQNPTGNNELNNSTDNPSETPESHHENTEHLTSSHTHDQEEESQQESTSQPDQEPENQGDIETPGISENGDHAEVIMYTCHEVANAFTVEAMDTMAWKCEFDMDLGLPLNKYMPSDEESWAMLATTAKKQRTEVKLTELSPTERAEFQAAKESEIQNWIKTGTISTILRHQIPEEQILRCRWILTWKPIDNAGQEDSIQQNAKTHKAKARLVVLGYLDPRIEELPRDSPTLNKTSRMLALQVIASHAWQLRSFDIKAAFLQGQPQADRITAIDPVPELRRALNLQTSEVCKLNKSAYGLIDAPYLWYCALVSELMNLGFEQSPFDPCLMILRSYDERTQQTKLEGVLGIHVDDGIGGGSELFVAKIQQLEKKFPFGSQKFSSFTFTGIELTQHGDYSISMSQSNYVKKIKAIPIETNRKTQLESPVTEPERLSLRALVGSLQYAAINTRPDLSSKLSLLQSAINKATVDTLMEGNRVLHEAKKYHHVTINIKPIPHQDFRFLAFSDASFSSPSKPDSHAGSIIVGTHQDISKNFQCPISPLTWGCRKIQKVVTSTLAAETMALSSTLDQLSWLRLFWSWIHDPNTEWKNPEETLKKIHAAITIPTKNPDSDMAITDCKSLYDLVTKTAPPQCSEFRVQLMARAIRESLREGTHLRWVPSGAQLADALTKSMESHFLRETLSLGTYRIYDEEATLKARARSKDRLRWLKTHETTSESHALE